MKKLLTIAAIMLASLTANAHQFKAHWLNECTSVGSVSFEFKSEKVCQWFDHTNDSFILVYHDPDHSLDHEELVVENDLFYDWYEAAAWDRIIRVRIMWNPKAERFEMVRDTFTTWESEEEIIYPEM